MFREFRKFIARGNVIDLAVGIVIGTAFTAIVNSLVRDIIMPPLGILIGETDFSKLSITLRAATADSEAVTIGIGVFINACVQFLIVAFAVFIVVRMVNRVSERLQREQEEPQEAASAEPVPQDPVPQDPVPQNPVPQEPTTDEKLLQAVKELTATIRALRRPRASGQPGSVAPPREARRPPDGQSGS